MQSYFIKSLATWIKVIEGRCPPNESPFLVRTPCPRFKTLPTKRNLALQHVIFMNFVCWKIHGPWQWDSPWQVRSLNPAPLVQDLMAPTWRDPCLSCAYFVMVLAHPHFSRLAATYLSITCTTHHDILWPLLAEHPWPPGLLITEGHLQ